jgi:GNAT superfamily N-acetyltransferase
MSPPSETRDLQLRDRRSVRLRPLRPSDRDLYERAVLDLSPRSRYLRFHAPITKPSERLLDQMTITDGYMHVAHLALTDGETVGVGVVRYVRSREDPRIAEVAIAINDDWQGQGLGVELLRHAAGHARLAGVTTLTGITLRENAGAARLLRASGFVPLHAAGLHAEYRMQLGS